MKYNKKQFLKHSFREKKAILFELKDFLLLWATQTFSGLGSGMTSFALVLWSYEQKGSALTTSLLMVCSYAPYVILSIFAGALSDRWNKKNTMLVCDSGNEYQFRSNSSFEDSSGITRESVCST